MTTHRRTAAAAAAGLLALLACACPFASSASADSGAPFAESSRAAGLANAVTADPEDGSAIHFNPGALAWVDRSVVTLGAHAGRLSLWFARSGEPGVETHQTIAGFHGALVVRLPGPPWLRRVRLGVAAHVPSAHALEIRAPTRVDAPRSPYYGDRAGRIAATATVGVELPHNFGIGLGVTLTPTLWAPTLVRYDASRSDDPDGNVLVDLERELRVGGAMLAGLSYRPLPTLAFGLTWRQAQSARAIGPNDITAGPIRLDAEIDFFEFFAPQELTLGAWAAPLPELRLSADIVWAQWSRYRTIHDERPDLPFADVIDVRAGVEWRPRPVITARAGWAWEPSPVPEQRGTTNFVDADRHALAVGLGLDFESAGWARLRVDLHLRWHLLTTQRADKDPSLLPDANPGLPGRQVENLGWPGFRAGGSLAQAGITLTVPLSARQTAPAEDAEEEPP